MECDGVTEGVMARGTQEDRREGVRGDELRGVVMPAGEWVLDSEDRNSAANLEGDRESDRRRSCIAEAVSIC